MDRSRFVITDHQWDKMEPHCWIACGYQQTLARKWSFTFFQTRFVGHWLMRKGSDINARHDLDQRAPAFVPPGGIATLQWANGCWITAQK